MTGCVQIEDWGFGVGEVVLAGEYEVGGKALFGSGRRGREGEDGGGKKGEKFRAGGREAGGIEERCCCTCLDRWLRRI